MITYDEVKSDYHDQIDKINEVVKDLQKKLDRQSNNARTITSAQVVQQLKLSHEPDAISNLEILNNQPLTTWVDKSGNTSILNKNGIAGTINGEFLRVTYTNLKNSSYKGNIISKIVVTFSDSKPNSTYISNPNGGRQQFLVILKDPADGIYHATQLKAAYQYYDSNDRLINFDTNDAWISINSLNSWSMTGVISEAVKGGNGTTAYQLDGSSIRVHDDGWAYSDFDNYSEETSAYPEKQADNGTLSGNGDASTSDGSRGWDYNNSPFFFYGSILYLLKGNKIELEYKNNYSFEKDAYSDNDNSINNGGAWASVATIIPKTILPKVSYHYSTVIACLRLHR
ncbi:hypothetical protein JEM51_07005 [Ligilactobacillus agilis]|uniref:GbpC/Spa domain-containing protein n=1 Tax=Ligilactobacillus agilis TaxID=1601 RepID=UPI00191FAB59|nr:GbpC/Spa domain-containing protein [Ligilactobacillus agilis]MBL1056172.1 hypothetical protein [Ligilactobacillus agilis]